MTAQISRAWEARFFLTLGCGVVCSFLLWFGKLDSTAYASIIIATVGAFIAGDTYEKATRKMTP